MVSRSYITRNLKSLNKKYIQANTQAEPLYYSKLAIIELCGWIEISIDEIINSITASFVDKSDNVKKIEGALARTYGFSTTKNLLPLLATLIGRSGIEQIEKSCDTTKLNALYRNLNELSIMRNELAHTYIKGFTTSIESPQLILNRLKQVADGLDHLEDELNELSHKLNSLS